MTGDELSVQGLTVDGEEVTFPGRDAETDPVPYSDPESECALDAADVAGPNGQVNHGMFTKLFDELYEGTGRGCLNRYLAQSDLGKGDQQIKVGDVDPDSMPVTTGDTGEVTFSTGLATCEHGKTNGNSGRAKGQADDSNEHSSAKGNGNGNGKN